MRAHRKRPGRAGLAVALALAGVVLAGWASPAPGWRRRRTPPWSRAPAPAAPAPAPAGLASRWA